MKLAINLLVVLVVAASAQQMTVHERTKNSMRVWAVTMAHCREVGADGAKVDMKKTKACKKCHSGVGNWFTDDGLARGLKCLEEFEPEAIKSCGEMAKTLPESGFDPAVGSKVIACWEKVHLNTIGEKCLKATGGKDMVVANLCMLKHMIDDHQYAEKIILGEDVEEKSDPTAEHSKLQKVVESLFVEGRCIHANEGDQDRTTECITCFDHVSKMSEKMEMKKKKHMMEGKCGEHKEDANRGAKKLWSLYGACANVYLAPAYSDCFDGMDEVLEMDVEEWKTPTGGEKIEQLQGCYMLKQSNYWFKDCKEAGGEGIEGLMSFFGCSKNTTISWVASRRPEAVDMIDSFMKGMGKTEREGGLVTSLI